MIRTLKEAASAHSFYTFASFNTHWYIERGEKKSTVLSSQRHPLRNKVCTPPLERKLHPPLRFLTLSTCGHHEEQMTQDSVFVKPTFLNRSLVVNSQKEIIALVTKSAVEQTLSGLVSLTTKSRSNKST